MMQQVYNRSFVGILVALLTLILPASASGDWSELLGRLTSADARPVRFLHLGDSHLSGGYMTAPITQMLISTYGSRRVTVERIGVPGATFATFASDKYQKKIQAVGADVIIVSLGTNDAFSNRLDETALERNMKTLMELIAPGDTAPLILMTTPPLSYLPKRVRTGVRRTKRKRRVPVYTTTYTYNHSTEHAARLIVAFARHHGYACYDLNAAMAGASGELSAAEWLRRGELHRDRVHYTQAGYRRIGTLVAEALKTRLTQAGQPLLSIPSAQ